MSDDPRIADLRQRLLRPESANDVLATLPVLDDLKLSSQSRKAAEELLRRAFECFRKLTDVQPDYAVEILIGELLPRCLSPDREADTNFGPKLCYTFGEWMDDLPEEQRYTVRDQALARAVAALAGNGVRNAIRLISSIGYRNDAVIGSLDRVARQHDGETRDHALSALIALRPALSTDQHAFYLEMLHARIPFGPNLHQLGCARLIGNQTTAELIWAHWLATADSDGSKGDLYSSLAYATVVHIAERQGAVSFTARVWDWLVELSRRHPEGVDPVFGPNSSLINSLQLPVAIPYLVGLAIGAEGHGRYLYYLRALECERPALMAGWDSVPLDELGQVRADAARPSGNKGRFTTIELHQKEAAWDILLCRGDAATLPHFGDALNGEGGYVIHRMLELASCLGLKSLPPLISGLLAGTIDETWDSNERLVAQIGAIEAARGACTREAFDALLQYRQLGEGVLLRLVEALAETCLTLLESGDRFSAEEILSIAESSQREDSRAAAAGATAALIEEGALTSEESARAAALLAMPGTDPFARRELLFAFASRPVAEVPKAAVDYATNVLAAETTDHPVDLRSSALALVARQPRFWSDSTIWSRHLGLIQHGEEVVTGPSALRGVVPHILARRFAAEPDRFGQVVASILREGDGVALANVLPSVREAGSKNPVVVLEALLTRLRRTDSGRSTEPQVLRTLARVAPDLLLDEGCANVASWLPQARADLADVLGELGALPARSAGRRFEILSRLAGDGVYAVRRAAYRAAATCDFDQFVRLASGWLQWREPGRKGPRRYAAECAGWLPPEGAAERFAVLANDEEPGVRESYEQSVLERRNRNDAEEFERRILGVNENAEIIKNWRYGIALSHVGDDSTIRRLTDRMGAGLRPAVRFWLKRVQKAVEKRWGGVTRNWPEPWSSRPGNLEKFSGFLLGEAEKKVAITGTLWLMPAETPGGRGSWGGWATCETWWTGNAEAELVISGKRAARLLIGSSLLPASEIAFSGNGPYPEPVDS